MYRNQQTTSAWEASSTDNTDEDLIPRRVPVRRTKAASRFNTPATFPVPSAFRTVALVRRCYRSISKSLTDDHVAQLTHYVTHCLTFTGASYQSRTSARTVDHTWPPHAGRWSGQRQGHSLPSVTVPLLAEVAVRVSLVSVEVD